MSTGTAATEYPVTTGSAPETVTGSAPETAAGSAPADAGRARWALPARDVAAIALAGVGTLLLFVSLLVDWQRVQLPGADQRVRLDAGIGDIPTWGIAYVLGSMIGVALFVGVIVLPVQIGRAARVLGIAWMVIIGGVVAATIVRLAEGPADLNVGLLGGLFGDIRTGGLATTWGPGVYVAAAALAAMIGAFAAACPPLRESESGQR